MKTYFYTFCKYVYFNVYCFIKICFTVRVSPNSFFSTSLRSKLFPEIEKVGFEVLPLEVKVNTLLEIE